jgi:hypothetical protein
MGEEKGRSANHKLSGGGTSCGMRRGGVRCCLEKNAKTRTRCSEHGCLACHRGKRHACEGS